ncbi:hypothetical protein [Saprospira grandis]|uniref:Uncharacterized protein n=1 Tax=Saprospira grandis (strain Lewin) TaxID=984262 RepID=H6L3Q3_SAPGL|nr:hypothetical protein [Saprospira grandis]AFC25001.1 hypothetical protein SGRA_2272 [Saprospira grandis str. Lewin]WBM73138.1 hypothetical protein OP864_08995 [Saprospira grandis]
MAENRISIELTTDMVEEVRQLVTQIEEKLPFLLSLTQDERASFPKLHRENEIFVEETIRAAEQHDDVLPDYIDVAEMKRDLELYQQLGRVMLRLNRLHEKVNDTIHIAGAEALATALVTNNMFQIAAKMGVNGMDRVSSDLMNYFNNEEQEQ